MADPVAGIVGAPTTREAVRDHFGAMVRACGRRRVVALLLVQVGAAGSEAVALGLLVPVIGVMSGADSVALPLLGRVAAWVVLALLAAAVLVRAAFQWLAAVLAHHVRARTSDAVRLEALRALFAARWTFLAAQRRSHLVQSLTTEAQRILTAVDTLLYACVAVLVLLAVGVVILTVSPVLGGLAVAGVLVLGLLARTSVARSATLGAAAGRSIDEFGGAVTDSLAAARVIRAHDAQERWLSLAAEEAARARSVVGAFVRGSTAVSTAMGVLSVAAAIALVVLGRLLELDAARVIALGVLATRLVAATQTLVSEWQLFANNAPALAKVQGLSAAAQRDAESPAGRRPARDGSGAAALPRSTRSTAAHGPGAGPALLELHGVTVAYPGASRAALLEVDLRLERGRLTVVTGPSGAGKSTLLDVVLGLLRPSAGVVLADGRPVEDLPAWRGRIGYVPQDGILVPGTVRENLVWSLQPGRAVVDDRLWGVLADAALADVVRALPDGLSTRLGETAELSGGERQRLALARALLRTPELLVLDEATSALDERTEGAVLDRIRAAHRTTVFVSHRPQVMAAADVVVRLSGGRIVD